MIYKPDPVKDDHLSSYNIAIIILRPTQKTF